MDTIYIVAARATVALYALMSIAAWRASRPREAAIAALFAAANLIIFCWRTP